jgi:sugar phosphate permease
LSVLGSSSIVEPVEGGERTRRQIAMRLLPLLFILYAINYIDRTSVAFAALGMSSDLGLSDRALGLAGGIFFLAYVALQIPGALLVERWSARRAIALVIIAWGCATALTGLIRTSGQLYGARLVLGAAEAGFFPGVIVYLSHWFSRADRAKATAYFMAGIPFSQAIASPLAGWIVAHSFGGLHGWRWLFILEGLPAVVLGVVGYFYLTDHPKDAQWLSAPQREWMTNQLRTEALPPPSQPSFLSQALASRTVLLLALITFLNYFVSYGFYFWFPTMLKRQSGLSDVLVGLIGAIPYAVSFIAMLLNGWHSDRRMERRWHAGIPCLLAAFGALGLMAYHSQSLPAMVFLFTLIALSTAFLPAFWAIPTVLLSRSEAAAAVGFINAVASVAGFAAPYLLGFLSSRTGSFAGGMAATATAGIVACVLLVSLPKAMVGEARS